MVGSSIITRGSGFQYTPILTRGFGQLVEVESVAVDLSGITGKSGIITRGYGYRKSSIITRGYARVLDAVQTAIENTIPRVRYIKGKSTKFVRTYKDYETEYNQQIQRYEEICVSVELVGLHDENLIDSIKNEVCQQLDKKRISVEIVDVQIVKNESTTSVIVNTVRIAPNKQQALKVIAKRRK